MSLLFPRAPKARGRPLRGRFQRGAGTAVIVAREEKLGRVRRKLTVVTGLLLKSLVVSPIGLAWITALRADCGGGFTNHLP